MAGKGGYQAPRNPAPASGPGKLARRTDGGPAQNQTNTTGEAYGANAAMDAQVRSAPMVQADAIPTAPVVTGLHEPTTLPNQPVTNGVDIGPGAGSEALSNTYDTAAASYGGLTTMLSQLAGADVSGTIAALTLEARNRGI